MTEERAYECAATLRYFDTLTGNEPRTELDLRAVEHAEGCESCAAELDRRAQLRRRLKESVRRELASPALEYRIRRELQEADRQSWASAWPWNWGRPRPRLAVVAAICIGVLAVYEFGRTRLETFTQDVFVAALKMRVERIFGPGLGDHLHCAWFRKFPGEAPAYAELLTNMGAEYAGLAPLVEQRAPEGFRIVMAHQCSYLGRRFIHVTLRSNANLASLVITRKQPGETFRRNRPEPDLRKGDVSLYRAAVQRFHIAGFESGGYLVYFVSDLDARENMEILAAMAPEVGRFLDGIGG